MRCSRPGCLGPRAHLSHTTPAVFAAKRCKRNVADMSYPVISYIDVLVSHFTQVTSSLSLVGFFQKSGAMRRGPHDQTAFGHREAQYALLITAMWLDPRESAQHIRWARELSEAIAPFTSGSEYVNDLGQEAEEGRARIKAGYGSNYERLVALKTTYDPANLFRHNQNILPTV